MAQCADSLEETIESFPCHFNWRLEENCDRHIQLIIHHLENHLKDHPGRLPGPAKTFRGYLCLSSLNQQGEKDPQEALKWFNDALEDISLDVEGAVGDWIVTMANKARTLLLLGDIAGAEQVAKELQQCRGSLKCEKVMAHVYVNEAFALSWLGPNKSDRGVRCYENALKVSPRKKEWLFGYALFFSKFNAKFLSLDQEQAVNKQEKLYRKILRENSADAFTRVLLASNLAHRDSDLEALFHYEKALEDGGGDVTVVQRVAEHYHWKGKFDEAVDTFSKALDLDSRSPFINHQLGNIYKKIAKSKGANEKEEYEKEEYLRLAIRHFDKALELDESRYTAFRDKVHALPGLCGNDEMREWFDKLLCRPRENERGCHVSDAHLNYARYLERLNKRSENLKAMEHYKKSLAADPKCISGQDAAKILSKKQMKVLSENPQDVEALKMVGWVYTKIGHLDSACFYYEKAYEIEKTDFIAFRLADLFALANNPLGQQKYLNLVQYSDEEESELLKIATYHKQNGEQYEAMLETDSARKQYAMAAYYRSVQGCEKLLEILKKCKDDDKFEQQWFDDCVLISHNIENKEKIIERKGKRKNSRIKAKVERLKTDLEQIAAPSLAPVKDLYWDYISLLSKEPIADTMETPWVDSNVICEAKRLLQGACKLLHRCVADFEKFNYGIHSKHEFFRVSEGNVAAEVRKITRDYGWENFAENFGKLFLFLVEVQHTNTWLDELLSKYDNDDYQGLPLGFMNLGISEADGSVLQLVKKTVLGTVKIAREFYKYIGDIGDDDDMEGAASQFF
ncbi:interferon-induced protein with tetratricopeptide repeats 1-like isoform X1 [Ptychodera flava]|uniref:interferon-induced protein with tetratricopeptide repeats 1-like isoform X1 n=1 Tax=Ptychodera flava TaxID=63121 RepID=UPI00396A9FB4